MLVLHSNPVEKYLLVRVVRVPPVLTFPPGQVIHVITFQPRAVMQSQPVVAKLPCPIVLVPTGHKIQAVMLIPRSLGALLPPPLRDKSIIIRLL